MSKLTPADQKFIAKFIDPDGSLGKSNEKETVQNKFSGAKVETTALVAKLINFILRLEEVMYYGRGYERIHTDLKATNAVMNFDRARYCVMKLDNSTYMAILD